MDDYVGLVGLTAAGLVSLVLGVKNRRILLILLVAFFVRFVAALIHFYVTPLPDGSFDAVTFEIYAWEWGKNGFFSALIHYPGMDAYFYSWLMSLVYSLFGRSLLLLQSINIMVSIFAVYATYCLGKLLWGGRSGRKSAWIMALFPSVVQYSVLPMRETWVVLFFILGLIGVVRWKREGGILSLSMAFFSFLIASFFHGGMFVAIFVFLGLVLVSYGKGLVFAFIGSGRIGLSGVVVLVVSIGFILFYIAKGIYIPKLGSAMNLLDIGYWQFYFESRVEGSARYPSWIQPESPVDLVWAVPVRAVYLLFSPFLWDVRQAYHFFGFVDGVFYLAIVFFVWRNRSAIFSDPAARSVFFILVGLVFAFGVGTGNFGTALRHRAKLVVGLIVLASPHIPVLRFRKKIFVSLPIPLNKD